MRIFGTQREKELEEKVQWLEKELSRLQRYVNEDRDCMAAMSADNTLLKAELAALKALPEGSLRELMAQVREWSDHNWPRRSLLEPLCSAVEELGELMRAHTKGARGIRGTPEHWDGEAQKEWADTLIALLDYAALKKWDLRKVIFGRWQEVRQRDWVKFPKNGKTE